MRMKGNSRGSRKNFGKLWRFYHERRAGLNAESFLAFGVGWEADLFSAYGP